MDHYTGGGLESYPRLTTFTRYRSVDNVTSMHQARKILLLTFRFHCAITTRRITEKRGSLHHARKYINANISLGLPPRDLVVDNKQVVNLHWSTCSVNYLMNTVGAQPNSFIVDSKDAERIVLAETWENVEKDKFTRPRLESEQNQRGDTNDSFIHGK